MKTRAGNITNVGRVGHWSRNPTMIARNPTYWGWRTHAYGPVVARVLVRAEAHRTRQPLAISQKPPPMNR